MSAKKLIDHLEQMQRDLEKLPKAFAEKFVARVKQKTPVDTGTLQRGWEYQVDETTVTIKNEVPYAPFVEEGTEKMAPVGMLRTTIVEAPQILEEAWKQVRK